MSKYFFALLLFSLGQWNLALADSQSVPGLSEHVTDLTGTLTENQKTHIESILKQLKTDKGSQFAILIVASTEPEAIEEYSLRVVERWKLGRKGVDDGVLLLIAKDDRKMRIEVGYGLEGAITDIYAGRIINEYITPEFRRNNFYQGILAGTEQIVNLINGEELPATSNQGSRENDAVGIFAFIAMGSSFLTSFLVPLFGRLISVAIVTIGGAVIVWFISHSVSLVIFAAFVLALFSLGFSGSRSSSYRDGGGYGGGFGGGGSFGGGGFSGGGGGFGGGGASGGW